MSVEPGLRERKKRQTRRLIADTAHRLFTTRGFDAVTVAEVARTAEVSEVTVFNYFPTKEDLFYGGMLFWETAEDLPGAPPAELNGQTIISAEMFRRMAKDCSFRRLLLESSKHLAGEERADFIATAAKTIAASPALQARERDIVARYTRDLAAMLATELGAGADDAEAAGVAAALMGVHRALVEFVRAEVLRGRRGPGLSRAFRAQAARAFSRLEVGLGDYGIRSRPPGSARTGAGGARSRSRRRPHPPSSS